MELCGEIDLLIRMCKMRLSEQLQSLQNKLGETLNEYNLLVDSYKDCDLARENEELKQAIDHFKNELNETKSELSLINEENEKLQTALYNRFLNERFSLLESSRQKLATYFPSDEAVYSNELKRIEYKICSQLAELKKVAQSRLHEESTVFINKAMELERELHASMDAQMEAYKKEQKALLESSMDELDSIADMGLSPEMLEKRQRQEQWEMKIGLNVINKVAILLILLGVGAAFKYTFDHWMGDHLKSISFFLIGLIFIIGGESFYRRHNTIFATGLLGGGIAILYAATFYSYFLLEALISLNMAFFLSILITATAALLALRYDSQTIGSLALAGGFLPVLTLNLTIGLSTNILPLIMGYLFLLNFLLLLISFYKEWKTIRYLSFILNTPALIYLLFSLPSVGWGIFFTTLTFLMYTSITVGSSLIKGLTLHLLDLVLLALNTAINAPILYLLFSHGNLDAFMGVLSIIFALFFIFLGGLVQQRQREDTKTRDLFFGMALTFAIIAVPAQFGQAWISLGWLVQAVFLIIYGSRKESQRLHRAGWIIFALCLLAFYRFELFYKLFHNSKVSFFSLKYLAITLGQILVLMNYLILNKIGEKTRKVFPGEYLTPFRIFTILNLWFYVVYNSWTIFGGLFAHAALGRYFHSLFTAFFTLTLGYVIVKIPILRERAVQVLSNILMIMANIQCVYLNTTRFPATSAHSYVAKGVGLIFLIVFNILILFNVRDLVTMFITGRSKEKSYWRWGLVPLFLGLYLLFNLSSILVVQLNLSVSGFYFNLAYFLLALTFIGYGFKKRASSMRWLGLGLILFSLTKLFLFDLAYLRDFSRIIAYFTFGLILLVISLLYQKIKTLLEEKDANKIEAS